MIEVRQPTGIRPVSLVVTPFSFEGASREPFSGAGPSGAAWGTANLGLYFPVTIQAPVVFTHACVANGATASGNVDIGLYDDAWNRITSTGSTAQSGTSTVQVIDITDILVTPGRYYIALALSSATGTVQMTSSGNAMLGAGMGWAQETSALPLPATATPARYAQTFAPWFGFSRRATM